ncbi:MAG: hypothetical protein ABJC09_12215 [Terriglobia bacterium]
MARGFRETYAAALDTDPSNSVGAIILQKEDLDALPDDIADLTVGAAADSFAESAQHFEPPEFRQPFG